MNTKCLPLLISLLVIPAVVLLPTERAASEITVAQADSRQREAGRLLEQGRQQFDTSQFQAALQSYQQALELYRDLATQPDLFQEGRRGEGNALRGIGNVYTVSAQYDQAIDMYEQALGIARELRDRDGESRALGNLGLAYNSLGQYDRAIDFYEQSLAIAREMSDRAGEGRALTNLANAYNFCNCSTRLTSVGLCQKMISFCHEGTAPSR